MSWYHTSGYHTSGCSPWLHFAPYQARVSFPISAVLSLHPISAILSLSLEVQGEEYAAWLHTHMKCMFTEHPDGSLSWKSDEMASIPQEAIAGVSTGAGMQWQPLKEEVAGRAPGRGRGVAGEPQSSHSEWKEPLDVQQEDVGEGTAMDVITGIGAAMLQQFGPITMHPTRGEQADQQEDQQPHSAGAHAAPPGPESQPSLGLATSIKQAKPPSCIMMAG